MSTPRTTDLVRYQQALSRRDAAAEELYETEVALHAARQSRVDEWVRAASDHLHMALLVLDVAEADLAAAMLLPTVRDEPVPLERELCPVPVRRRR